VGPLIRHREQQHNRRGSGHTGTCGLPGDWSGLLLESLAVGRLRTLYCIHAAIIHAASTDDEARAGCGGSSDVNSGGHRSPPVERTAVVETGGVCLEFAHCIAALAGCERVAAQSCIASACCLALLNVSCLPAERTNVLIYAIQMSISWAFIPSSSAWYSGYQLGRDMCNWYRRIPTVSTDTRGTLLHRYVTVSI
jgi:hypothetical protein